MDDKERLLLLEYKNAKEALAGVKDELDKATEKFEKAQAKIQENLENKGADATGKYPGLGWVQIQKPRLYANCRIDDQALLFGYLNDNGRPDLIKTTVNPQSLSSFIAEQIDQGAETPEFINVYFKQQLRHYGV